MADTLTRFNRRLTLEFTSPHGRAKPVGAGAVQRQTV
jgi:hypothetical protein